MSSNTGVDYDESRTLYSDFQEETYFGTTIADTSAGIAGSQSVYLDHNSTKVSDFNVKEVPEGAVCELRFKGRRVKTPFRVNFIVTGKTEEKEHQKYGSDDTYTVVRDPYVALLEPLNNTTEPRLISGRPNRSTDMVGINYERTVTTKTASLDQIADKMQQVIAEECPDNPRELVRSYDKGEVRDNAQMFSICTDPTIARLLDVSTPALLTSEI